MTSLVFVENVAITAVIGPDCWGRSGKAQPILVSVTVEFDTSRAAKTDSIDDALDYRNINKIIKKLDGSKFDSLEELEGSVSKELCRSLPEVVKRFKTCLNAPKAVLYCDAINYEVDYDRSSLSDLNITNWTVNVCNLRVLCIVGIGSHERVTKQEVIINLSCCRISPRCVGELASKTHAFIEMSSYMTIEKMAEEIVALGRDHVNGNPDKVQPDASITVRIQKPDVFATADGPGVQITRMVNEAPNTLLEGDTAEAWIAKNLVIGLDIPT